jgi:hypothetical protein
MEAINDMLALKETCRDAFESSQTSSSVAQQQVSETLRHMGLSVEDEARCPKSGYSIDLMVHDSGRGNRGERSSSTSTWAVEFDGPSHFLTSRAPTGATLLKRRHLELLGHALVTVPYWEWDGCKTAGEREQYLRGKLACFVQAGHGRTNRNFAGGGGKEEKVDLKKEIAALKKELKSSKKRLATAM